MKPSASYKISAAFYSYSISILVGYPCGAVTREPGIAPVTEHWFLLAIGLGTAMAIYSSVPKHPILLAANVLVLPLVGLLIYLICLQINYEAVSENAGMIVFFSIFTLGLPFWPMLAGFIWHVIPCGMTFEETPNKQIN